MTPKEEQKIIKDYNVKSGIHITFFIISFLAYVILTTYVGIKMYNWTGSFLAALFFSVIFFFFFLPPFLLIQCHLEPSSKKIEEIKENKQNKFEKFDNDCNITELK